MTPNFLATFSKTTKILNLMKIRLLGAELFHGTGRRTDRQT
jgi:hypothetical protein